MKTKNKEDLYQIIKYLFSAGSSFGIDLVLFTVFVWLLGSEEPSTVIVATILARVLSSIYNYFVNSRLVFKERGGKRFFGYVGLVTIQMLISAGSVAFLTSILKMNSTVVKIFVDGTIFVVNYLVQKFIVFRA